MIDRLGAPCFRCRKGTMQETRMTDDMDGVLHCSEGCGQEVRRHSGRKLAPRTTKPKKEEK